MKIHGELVMHIYDPEMLKSHPRDKTELFSVKYISEIKLKEGMY